MKRQRLFFALWPDAATRAELAAVQTLLFPVKQGRIIPAADFHLTLCFIGDVSSHTGKQMAHAAAGLRVPRFALQLDHCGHWHAAQLVYVSAHTIPPQLQQLVADLSAVLQPYGYVADRQHFAAHVTMGRNIVRRVNAWPQFKPINWQVEEFVLASSHPGDVSSLYHIDHKFPLR